MSKLLTCPFCGGPAVNVAFEIVTCGNALDRDCLGHDLRAPVDDDNCEISTAWNTRAALHGSVVVSQAEWDNLRAILGKLDDQICATKDILTAARMASPVSRQDPPCECGFTVDVCATNHCHRKQISSAGLSPVPDGYSKLPRGAVCKCFKMWRDKNGDHWCCLPFVTRHELKTPQQTSGENI